VTRTLARVVTLSSTHRMRNSLRGARKTRSRRRRRKASAGLPPPPPYPGSELQAGTAPRLALISCGLGRHKGTSSALKITKIEEEGSLNPSLVGSAKHRKQGR
jgi:hypothetical protein